MVGANFAFFGLPDGEMSVEKFRFSHNKYSYIETNMQSTIAPRSNFAQTVRKQVATNARGSKQVRTRPTVSRTSKLADEEMFSQYKGLSTPTW